MKFQAADGATYGAKRTEVDTTGICVVSRDVRAIRVRNATEFKNACNQSADEAKINEGYKVRVGARAMIGEERCDCPGCCEHRDDEENEDVVRCQGIHIDVLMDEPR